MSRLPLNPAAAYDNSILQAHGTNRINSGEKTMTNQRPPNERFTHISEVLSRVVGQIRRETDTELSRIQQIWQQVLDPVIAENSRPAALKNDILLVHVASSTVTQQLRFLTPDIIEQLNRVLGDERIGKIQYKVGPVSPRDGK